MTNKEIVKELIDIYGERILDINILPKAFCPGGVENVKAIYLGCDPSNIYSTELPYVFAHNLDQPNLMDLLNTHYDQLERIGLNWEDVYAQNLCRNYFRIEISRFRLWKKVANEYWIDKLIEELSQFDLKIPVLLTAQRLLEVLGTDGYDRILANDFYKSKKPIPIPADKNKLNRELIPLYVGKNPNLEISYYLKNDEWMRYRNSVKRYFKKKNEMGIN